MNLSKEQSIEIMNLWGAGRVPFLFVVDYEMKSVLLFRTDEPLPSGVLFQFPRSGNAETVAQQVPDFYFRKQPVASSEYRLAFDEVQRQIRAGNSFLVNLTFATGIETNLSLRDIFRFSKARYRLWIEDRFVCFSPETFVSIHDGIISTFPMKGTIRASVPNAEEEILGNPKETAEHHTIVDLLRNDLSMVASGVEVKRFRYIDRLATSEGELLQVSSEIAGILPANYHGKLGSIIFAMLPAGSITGAPKQKTVDIIRGVERQERGYYSGVCGHFDGNNLESAVMIRYVEKLEGGGLQFRSGGGITCNSDAESEYNELIDKVYVPIARIH
jgi:para-aminobenzoate synthetase component I